MNKAIKLIKAISRLNESRTPIYKAVVTAKVDKYTEYTLYANPKRIVLSNDKRVPLTLNSIHLKDPKIEYQGGYEAVDRFLTNLICSCKNQDELIDALNRDTVYTWKAKYPQHIMDARDGVRELLKALHSPDSKIEDRTTNTGRPYINAFCDMPGRSLEFTEKALKDLGYKYDFSEEGWDYYSKGIIKVEVRKDIDEIYIQTEVI